jgi:phage gp36-like protein
VSCYVTIQDVKDLGTLPAEDIDQLEVLYLGITLRVATKVSARFDSKLAKRYAAPFQEPYPDALIDQVARVVAYRLTLKRGFNPSSEQDQLIKEEKDEALAWLNEAADSKDGMVELPIRQTTPPDVAAVSAGGPLGYSEASPYTWTELQLEAVRNGG